MLIYIFEENSIFNNFFLHEYIVDRMDKDLMMKTDISNTARQEKKIKIDPVTNCESFICVYKILSI